MEKEKIKEMNIHPKKLKIQLEEKMEINNY